MITVIIRDNGEKSVIQMTYEDIWKQLKELSGAEIIVHPDWFQALPAAQNKFVCFVEPDCLVSPGYFASQVGIFTKNKSLRKLGILGTATGILNWANRIYGYSFGNNWSDGIVPNRTASSRVISPVQVAFVPGAIMRTKMLREVVKVHEERFGDAPIDNENLVKLSVYLSVRFWELGDGHRVAVNPSTTYVTTEEYPLEIFKTPEDLDISEMLVRFTKAGMR